MRLIDADEALRMIRNSKAVNPCRRGYESSIWRTAHDCAISCVEDAPTIEAKPVVHGEWVKLDVADYKCSVCGFRFTSGDPIAMFQYCRCGAKMDGGEHEKLK